MVLFIQAGTPRTAYLDLGDILRGLNCEVSICDPYYGIGSLLRIDLLVHCKKVRFLTRQADSKDGSIIDRALKEFVSEHPNVEFRKLGSTDIHDRYILADDEIILLGHGLKDIGTKESFVIRLTREMCADLIDTVKESFEAKWATATSMM
jgi:hypothetical protein